MIIDTEESKGQSAWFAVTDCKTKSAINVHLHSNAAREVGEQVATLARLAYTRSSVYINYRAKFIAVKVDNPQLADKITTLAHELDTYCTDCGIEVVKTARSIVFRIKA